MSNSNGMYNVLNIFKKLVPTQEQTVKAEAKAIYESVESKGSILEGVKSVEEKLTEKYMGFKKVAAAAKAGGAKDPDAVAASIGRKKYGKKAFQKAAAAGKKMGEEEQVDEMFAFDHKPGKDRGPRDTGRGDELARRERTLGTGGLGKGKPFGKEYKEKGKYGNAYDIAGPKGVLPEDEQVDEMFAFDPKPGKDRGPRDTGRGDELARRAKLGKNPLATGNPNSKEYKEKGKYGKAYDIAGPKGHLPEEQVDEMFAFPDNRPRAERNRARNKPQDKLGLRGGEWTTPGGKGREEYKAMRKGETPAARKVKDYYSAGGPKGVLPEDEQVDEMFYFDTKPGKDRGPRDTGRGDELARRERTLGKGGLGKGKPFGSEYKQKGKYGKAYDIAGPKGVLPEGEREDRPTIPGTDKQAKSRYNPTNKPAPVKKLDKPTDKFDKIKESRKRRIAEGINFAEMMKETDTSVAEMLSEIQSDIDSFKKTGHCSDKLEAFLKIHNHGKRLMGETVPKGPSFAPQDAMALAKPAAPFEPSRIQGKPSILDRARDAVDSVVGGVNKVIGHGSDEDLLNDLRNKSTFEAAETELNELARLAGLTENCEMTIGQGAVDMEQQQGRINVSTNASTDGNKNVTITADGDAADQLMSMLKMAGMGDSEAHARLASAEPEAIEVEMDEADEQYANAPEECYQGQDVIAHQGADMNREKKQFAGMPKAGDNPMATPTLQALESMDPMDDMGRRLMREYQSLKLRK